MIIVLSEHSADITRQRRPAEGLIQITQTVSPDLKNTDTIDASTQKASQRNHIRICRNT